jgi:hypothetical protein
MLRWRLAGGAWLAVQAISDEVVGFILGWGAAVGLVVVGAGLV